MTASNFDRIIAAVLKDEGGYSDHPSDPGGATKYGITQRTLATFRRENVTKADVKALTIDEAKAIYRKNYWNMIRGDDLPGGIDYTVFDYAVNSGPARAAKALQWAIGFKGNDVDGHIGDQTLAATDQATDAGQGKTIVNAICDGRMAFLKGLTTWPTFGKGWTRRVDGVRKTSLGMVKPQATGKAKQPVETSTPPEPVQEASRGGFWGIVATIVAAVGEALRSFKDHLGDFFDQVPFRVVVYAALAVALGAAIYAWRQRRLGVFAKPATEESESE